MDSSPIEYIDFNKKVYTALLDRSSAFSYVSTILLEIKLPCKEEIKVPDDWSNVIPKDEDGIPLYLGLIAIQVLLAAGREVMAYNKELSYYLGCSENQLQKKYVKAQEAIYRAFGKWCEENELSVYIPKQRRHAQRFVQYPLSLSLINKQNSELLKNRFYECITLQPGQYEFDEFWAKVGDRIDFPISLKNKLGAADPLLADDLKHQIYWYYLHWDGTCQIADSKKTQKRRDYCPKKFYWMIWNENADPLSAKITENEKQIDVSRLPDKIRNGCFFIQDEDYPDDWELCSPKTINPDTDEGESERHYAYVVVNAEEETLLDDIRHLSSVSGYSLGTLNIYTLTTANIRELITKHATLFEKEPCIKLERGIRFRYQNTWLEGCGPQIQVLNGCSGRFRLEKLSEDQWNLCPIDDVKQPLVDLGAGDYRLWYSETEMRLPIRFTIAAIERTDSRYLYPSGGGWWHDDNGQYSVASKNELADPCGIEIICGLDFSSVMCSVDTSNCNPVRQWMDLAIGKDTILCANENVIHKALRREKYGN